MLNIWCFLVFYLFASVWLVKCFPTNFLRERNSILDDSKVNVSKILNFMRKFGYLDSSSTPITTSETLYHEEAMITAIKNMQRYGALNETGILDNATLKLLNTPRCGVPDMENNFHPSLYGRIKRFVLGPRGWQKRHITYFISNWSPKVNEDEVAQGMSQAFDIWSKYSGLRFQRIFQPDADIIVAFGSGYHGDPFPFDGSGSILAHAFFPYEMTNFGGDIHFDNDENWQKNAVNLAEGVDFRSVAVHELGHSLGLAHSPVFSSIMFPYYKGPQESTDLDYDDIMGLYELYIKSRIGDTDSDQNDIEKPLSTTTLSSNETPGITTKVGTSYMDARTESIAGNSEQLDWTNSTETTLPSIETTSENKCVTKFKHHFSLPIKCTAEKTDTNTSASLPSLCENEYFDTIAWLRGEIFVFKGKYLWRFSDKKQLVPGYPVHFNQIFVNIPNHVERIDAAYERKTDGAIILFYGNMFWVFDGSDFTENSPRSITEYGFNSTIQKIDAAMVWNKNDYTYLFSGSTFVRYNEEQQNADKDYPKFINEKWHDIPNNLDAAISLENGEMYFFKGNLFWRYNNEWIRSEHDYPRRTSTNWFDC